MIHLETVQRKAARFVCNNYYGYSGVYDIIIVTVIEWQTLECQWLEARANHDV